MKQEKIEIPMTNMPPVRIDPEAWPIVAQANWHDGENEASADRTALLHVRKSGDRFLVYGEFTSGWRQELDRSAGEVCDDPGENMADLIATIRRVAAAIGDQGWLAQEAIQDLPPIDL